MPALLATLAVSSLPALAAGCGDSDGSERPGGEAREAPNAAARRAFGPLAPSRETAPVPHGGDAADDPAIWVNRRAPAKSAVIGTDKDGGIAVYSLAGKQLQYRADGEINNVDLRPGFVLGGRAVTLVTAGDRSDNTIAIYRLDERSRRLQDIAAREIHPGVETYGSCMYRSPRSRRTYYVVTSMSGEVEQWELFARGGKRVDARKVRRFDVGGRAEGCVADDRLARLYIGEESRGIWRYGAEPSDGSRRALVDSTGAGGHLVADVEGLAIAYGSATRGYLIASSQGDNSFVVYTRGAGNRYVADFRVRAGNGIDAVEETDGIDVTTANLGPAFRRGLFVVQDGRNDNGNQNFKLAPWRVPRPDRP